MPLLIGTSNQGCTVVVLGSFSSPGNHNVTFVENGYPIIEITGSGGGSGDFTITMPTPDAEHLSYRRVVINSTNLTLKLTIGSGGTVNVSAGDAIDIVVRTTGVTRVA